MTVREKLCEALGLDPLDPFSLDDEYIMERAAYRIVAAEQEIMTLRSISAANQEIEKLRRRVEELEAEERNY